MPDTRIFAERKGDGALRNRDIPFLFRLNREEADAFRERVKRSGLSQEAYVRQSISGKTPKDAPPPDYYSMMRELHKIGNNLNQIAQKAHVLNVIDVQRYDNDMRKFEEAVRLFTEAVILPEPSRTLQGLVGREEAAQSGKPLLGMDKGGGQRRQ